MGMRLHAALLFVTALWFGLTPGLGLAADETIGSYEIRPGVPTGTGKVVMEVTIVVNGKDEKKTVTIPSGKIKAWVRPLRQPTDTDQQYAQKLADSEGAATKAKAQVIVDAINAEFKNEVAKMVPFQRSGKKNIGGIPKDVTAEFGSLIISGVREKQGNPVKITESKVLGEGDNKGKFIGPAGKSPGSRSSLGRSTPGVETAATGFQTADTENDPPLTFPPSNVEFGIEGTYVAEFTPSPGMMDADVLSTLSSMLNLNGIPATFDPALVELFLDQPIPDGNFLVWGTSDPGLEFTFSMEGLAVAAPEPSTFVLLATGMLPLLIRLPRR